MFYCLSVAATAGALVPPADVALAWPEGEAAMEDFERRLRHLRRHRLVSHAADCACHGTSTRFTGWYIAEEARVPCSVACGRVEGPRRTEACGGEGGT